MASTAIDIVTVFVSSVGFLLNFCLSVLLIWKRKRLLKRKSNKLLLNLAISDAFMSFCVIIRRVLQHTELILLHKLFGLLMIVFLPLTSCNLIALTLDRMCAIKAPYAYANRMNSRHVYACICVSWTLFAVDLSLLVALLIQEYNNFLQYICISHVVMISLAVLILIIFNSHIYLVARAQRREIERLTSLDFRYSVPADECAEEKSMTSSQLKRTCSLAKEYRLVRMTIGLALIYVVCWTPYYAMIVTLLLTKRTFYTFEVFAWIMFTFNYLLDPLMYTSLSGDVKRELKKIFARMFKSKHSQRIFRYKR